MWSSHTLLPTRSSRVGVGVDVDVDVVVFMFVCSCSCSHTEPDTFSPTPGSSASTNSGVQLGLLPAVQVGVAAEMNYHSSQHVANEVSWWSRSNWFGDNCDASSADGTLNSLAGSLTEAHGQYISIMCRVTI
eukprot:3227763-Prymnesium_polylepis.1